MRVVGRRALVNHVIATAALGGVQPLLPASAWCGERFPSWAYYLKWDEVDVPFEFQGAKGSVHYRIVGDMAREQKADIPPILVVGNPGVGYDYMENMEALTISDRRVIEVTFGGTGPPATLASPLQSADACAAALVAVCKALKLPTVHVVAHGLGATPAITLASPGSGIDVRSLALVSPYASAADLRAGSIAPQYSDAAALAGALLPTVSGNARGSCVADARAAMSGGGALLPSLLAAPPPPPPIPVPTADGGAATVASLPPPDDGRLGRPGALGARLARLGPGSVPVFLASGGTDLDIVDTSGWTDLPATTKRLTFGGSGHMAFIDQNEQFLVALLDFLDGADGKATNREFKFADPIATIKEIQSS